MGWLSDIGDFLGDAVQTVVSPISSILGPLSGLGNSLSGLSGPLSAVGGYMSNQQSAEEASKARSFNSQEAGIQRDWSAQQADTQRNWSAAQAAAQMQFQREGMDTSMQYGGMMADRAMDFSERMANSAWQRATADMRAAGINPILSYQRGGAASPIGVSGSVGAPSGAMGSAGLPSGSAGSGPSAVMRDMLTPALNTAMQAHRTEADVAATNAGTDRTKADTELVQANTAVARAREQEVRTNTALAAEQITNQPLLRLLTQAQTARTQSERDRIVQEIDNILEYGVQGGSPGAIRSQLDAALRGRVGSAARDAVGSLSSEGDRISSLVQPLRPPTVPADNDNDPAWRRGLRGLQRTVRRLFE